MRSYTAGLRLALIASLTFGTGAFGVPATCSGSQKTCPDQQQPLQASSSSEQESERPKNLVEQAVFEASVENLQREIAKANGVEYQKPVLENGLELQYLLGRLEVSIPIQSMYGGLDLTESNGFVLCTGVSQETSDAGLQPLDTIVGVTVGEGEGSFHADVPAKSLEDVAAAMHGAMDHAMANKLETIDLELNRLIKGYFKDED